MSAANPISENHVVLHFEQATRPVFKEVRSGQFMRYGSDNLYPEYLLELYKSATRHGSIVSSKATYVSGKGWRVKGETEDPAAAAFIARVNRYDETLQNVFDKAILDLEIFYGAYIQVIWNNAGTGIAELYHLDFTKVRTNKDNTQFLYRDSWHGTFRAKDNNEKIYPAFNPKVPHGSQILFLKEYTPGEGAYPSPDYLRGLDYINAEIEVGRHTYGNALTGFSASKSITIYSGDPTDEEKRTITKRFTNTFSGAEGRKFILNFVPKPELKPTVDDLGQSDLTKEDFRAVDELVQGNIFSCHKITTPALFGIATPGALGQRSELRDGYEIFKNTYVNDKQQFVECAVNKLAKYFGVMSQLEIVPTDPIGMEITPAMLQSALSVNEIRAQAGLPAREDGDVMPQATGTTPAAMGDDTNPLLRDITGRQWQGIHRIIREVRNGKTTDAVARMMLASGYNLTDEQINVLLGTSAPGDELRMSAQESEDDKAIAMFAECGVTGEGLYIVKSRRVKYTDEFDAEIREHQILNFVVDELNALETHIIDLINKDKRITPEVIADVLKTDIDTVNKALRSLEESGVISTKGDTRTVNKVAKTIDKPKIKTFRVLYSYDGPKDSRNRPFCARLMELGRFYTRTEIESISARLGYSVWDRRGGFYHNPVTDVTTPYCRHTWVSHVVMETKS